MRLGKKVKAPTGPTIAREKDKVSGLTWSVERMDGKIVYEYMSGDVSGAIKRHEVTEEDFEAVFSGKMSDYDLLIKYDLS